MSTIHERLKALRKALHLTQVELGARIALSQGHLTSMENGKREITDRTIKMLEQEFNISEHWLRTGEGDMLRVTKDDEFSVFAARHKLTPAETEVMRYCFFLPPADRAALLRHITNLADTIRAAEDTEAAPPAEEQDAPAAEKQRTAPLTDEEIEAELANYRAELLAEREARSASEDGNAKRA